MICSSERERKRERVRLCERGLLETVVRVDVRWRIVRQSRCWGFFC
jgi:hypothetical protein